MPRTLHRFWLFCFLFLLAAPASPAQTTIHVPADQPTIQAGINAASNGDTVLVADGTYFENLVFHGKSITLSGVTPVPGQAPPTILDGSSKGPAIYIGSGEAPTISFFTIQHGGNFATTTPSVPATGGIEVFNGCASCQGRPALLNNLITGNNCWGILVAGSPYIAYNTISATQDPQGECGFAGGAGILVSGDQEISLGGETVPATIYANTIAYNVQNGFEDTGSSGGAGIAVDGGLPSIVSNLIHDNASPGGTGAGINIFTSTVHSGRGLSILQNVIYHNHAGCGGGGIATPTSRNDGQINLLIANNTLVDNTGDDSAGYNECAPINQIYPAPFSSTDNDPGFLSGPDTVIVNNIITGSTADPAVNCTPLLTPSEAIQPLFDHNILYNAGGTFFGSFCVDESARYGNISLDPAFTTDPSLLYQPSPTSPAIDAGNNSALAYIQQISGSPLPVDAAGKIRVQDATGKGYPVIDIGAYEYTPPSGIMLENGPTTLLLTSNLYAGPADATFTLTAVVAASHTATGAITFYSDNQPLGSALISNGVATLTYAPGPGVHAVYATYDGVAGVAPAISVHIIINVAKIATSILLQSDAIPPPGPEPSDNSVVGQAVTFTITSAAADYSVPSPVTLTNLDTNTPLSPPVTSSSFNSAGMAKVIYPGFSTPGRYRIQASYAGSALYSAGGDIITQIVTGDPTVTTLHCPSASIPFGATSTLSATVTSTHGTPTGTIDFSTQGVDLGDPALSNGAASVSYTASSPGIRSVVASYRPSGAFAASYATCNVSVQPQNTLALTSSSPLVNNIPTSPAYAPITFTATLTTTSGLTGAYSIAINGAAGNITGAMAADAAGTTATYTTSALPQGQYTVTATFNPGNNSSPITATLYPYQLVTAPIGDFTLTGPSSITNRTESIVSGTLTLTSINNFSGTVSLACNLPLPTTYTCSLSPTSVPLTAAGIGSVKVTLAPASRASNRTTSNIVLASLLPLALFSLTGFRRRRKLSNLLPLALLAILAASTTACGKDIYYAATPAGSYPFTVTATGATNGSTTPDTHTLNITLILTQ